MTRLTLSPYTTLFRSAGLEGDLERHVPRARSELDRPRPGSPARLALGARRLENIHAPGRVGQHDLPPVQVESLPAAPDRKSTRLNSSHSQISYAVFCL